MKRILALSIAFIILLSAFSVLTFQLKAANVSLTVTVFDESGFSPPSSSGTKKLSQVPVDVFSLDGSLVASGTTDNTGTLSLSLAEGSYNFVFGGLWAGVVGSSDKLPIGIATTKVTISSTTTTVNLYAFTITYHVYSFDGGGGWTFELDHIDMDLATAGYQTGVTANPGQQLTVEMAFWELETKNVPVWYVSAFGSWNLTQALSNLQSGTASPSAHRLYTKQFSFTAPTAPGTYYVRLLGHHDYTWPNSYYTGFHYNPTLGRDNGNEIISKGLEGSYGIGTITVTGESPTVDISAQYSTFVSARNNYKKIFGQDVAIGQTVERTLSGVINDPPAHYQWHSWSGQTYPDPPDGFSIRIETVQPDYVYKIIGLGYMAGSQPSASGWIKVNPPFKIEQINHVINYTWPDGSNVRLFANKDTGDITFSAKWYNYPALIDAGAFEFAITIAKPGGTLPPFSYDTTRDLASYAYDTDTKRLVMFGGRIWKGTSLRSDVWAFDPASSQWTSITTGSGPSNRTGASVSYNPVTQKFLVYGGGTYSGEATDTWVFQFTGSNTGTWTQIAGTGPPPRSGAPMVFDSKNNLFVLFGGERYVYSLGDTWVFNPSTSSWSNKNPSPAPPQRARAAMAYDEKSGKALLFGGLNKGAGSLLSDTWLYDAATNTWQQVSTATTPSARQWPSLASDGNGVFYLFGGWRMDAAGYSQYLSDTWKFDVATMQWTQLSPSQSPIAQSQGALRHIGSGKFVLMGGWRDSPLGDIWFYDPSQNTWTTTLAPTRTINVAVILAKFSDTSKDLHDVSWFSSVLPKLDQYYRDISYGAVGFRFEFYTMSDGDWFQVDSDYSFYSQKIPSNKVEVTGGDGKQYTLQERDNTPLFAWHAIQKADQYTDIDYDTFDTIIVVYPYETGRPLLDESTIGVYISQMGILPYNPTAVPTFDTFDGERDIARNWIVLRDTADDNPATTERDGFGSWVHELGHALGAILKNAILPDRYGKNGEMDGWDLMTPYGASRITFGNRPVHMSSYSKKFLGWINPQVKGYGTYELESIETISLDDSQNSIIFYPGGLPFMPGLVYYIVESRTEISSYGNWQNDWWAPDTGIILYQVTLGLPWDLVNKITIVSRDLDEATLKSQGDYYLDPFSLVNFSFVQRGPRIDGYYSKVAVNLWTPLNLVGVRLSQILSEIFSPFVISDLNLAPDLDLHAFASDGRHVGMNYSTGIYENQVAGAVASGDLICADEWIFVPPEINVTYMVSSRDIGEFLKAYPEYQTEFQQQSFNITHIYFDQIGNRYDGKFETLNISPNSTIQFSEIHDISISNVIASKASVVQGDTVSINVTVKNKGTEAETFQVTCYAGTLIVGSQSVTLPPGSNTTLTFIWNTENTAPSSYQIIAKIDQITGETNLSDNTFSDGSVTITAKPLTIFGFPLYWLIVIVILVATGTITALVILKRIRRRGYRS